MLWVSTKSPWPPVDGGRYAQLETIRGLLELGIDVRAVYSTRPRHSDRLRRAARMAVESRRLPLFAAWHRDPALEALVTRMACEWRPAVVHVEQAQSMVNVGDRVRAELPLVLRIQNIEAQMLSPRWSPRNLAFRADRRRFLEWEVRTWETATSVVTLSSADAVALQRLGPGCEPLPIALPFPSHLDAGSHELDGDPAVVLLGSRGWPPNEDALDWTLKEVWPVVRSVLPSAMLHVFGTRGPARDLHLRRIRWHGPLADSREAFARNAVLIAPIRMGGGVSVKVLEAWSRGVPVVATPVAVRGLNATPSVHYLAGRDPVELSTGVQALARSPELRSRLIGAGRSLLGQHHSPATVCTRIAAEYRRAIQLRR